MVTLSKPYNASKRTTNVRLGIYRFLIRPKEQETVAISGQWLDVSGFQDSRYSSWLVNWEFSTAIINYLKIFTHRSFSLVLWRKISSGKSFNWLFCKYLPTDNCNQYQLHDKGRLRSVCWKVPFPMQDIMVQKTRTIKKKIGENKTAYRILSMLFLSLENSEISELWDLFHLCHYA